MQIGGCILVVGKHKCTVDCIGKTQMYLLYTVSNLSSGSIVPLPPGGNPDAGRPYPEVPGEAGPPGHVVKQGGQRQGQRVGPAVQDESRKIQT